MSVIVKEPEGRILLLSKGADRLVLHLKLDFLVLVTYNLQRSACVHDFLIVVSVNSVMFKRLAPIGRKFEEETRSHINQYSDSGLRTFVLAYRVLDEKEYKEFNEKLNAAKASVSADKDEKIEQVADSIERDLILLGATAVEDKLQQGVCLFMVKPFCSASYLYLSREPACSCTHVHVHIQVPECIDKLAQAGIKMWVLTGDKLETAINIG
jgi:phospholipid-translocating ATPase